MNNLLRHLNLEYESHFNVRKAFAIIIGAVSLIVGISFLSKPDTFYRAIGSGAVIFFLRIVMGSPVEDILTPESHERLQAWVQQDIEKSDEEKSA